MAPPSRARPAGRSRIAEGSRPYRKHQGTSVHHMDARHSADPASCGDVAEPEWVTALGGRSGAPARIWNPAKARFPSVFAVRSWTREDMERKVRKIRQLAETGSTWFPRLRMRIGLPRRRPPGLGTVRDGPPRGRGGPAYLSGTSRPILSTRWPGRVTPPVQQLRSGTRPYTKATSAPTGKSCPRTLRPTIAPTSG